MGKRLAFKVMVIDGLCYYQLSARFGRKRLPHLVDGDFGKATSYELCPMYMYRAAHPR